MNDIFHEWGRDLVIDSSGDLALATGSDATNQRVCRRLLTNSGDYLWNRDYGGGIGWVRRRAGQGSRHRGGNQNPTSVGGRGSYYTCS
jgi:hypothetical protein